MPAPSMRDMGIYQQSIRRRATNQIFHILTRRKTYCGFLEAYMTKVRFASSCSAVFLIAFSMLACGNGNRLRSITISPATGNGHVQFIATGVYTDGSKVTPLPALWSEHNPWSLISVADEISVDSNGMASCVSVPGTFPVEATAPSDPHFPLSKIGPTTPQVFGSATITCP